MDLTSLRLLRHSRRLLMLRRTRYGAKQIAVRVAQSLSLRRRRNLQRDRSQGDGDTRSHPMSSSSVFCCSEDDPKRPSNDLARSLHTSCAGTRRQSAPIRPRTSRFALRRTSEANSCAWRPYPPRDTASHRHRRRRPSRDRGAVWKLGEFTRYRQEARMGKSSKNPHHGSVSCCAVCGGKFGPIRYYCWRTALCSRKCVDRLRVCREADHRWLRWLRAA
jgi:hypothetical protein